MRTATVGLPVSQTNPATHPTILTVCRRPALLGSGPPPGPPRQDGLDARSDAGGSGGGLLGLPGSSAGGMARTTTHGPQPADGVATISEPERPRRRRSNRNPATTASSPTRPACAPLRRAGSWPRGPAGCRPTTSRSMACRPAAAPWAPRFPRQPPGVLRGRSRSASGATDARPGGGACGPFRAALKTYRNFERGSPGRRQPVSAGCQCPAPVATRCVRRSTSSMDGCHRHWCCQRCCHRPEERSSQGDFAACEWWARQVSNLRPLACKASALPLSYAPGTPVRRAGAASLPARLRPGRTTYLGVGLRQRRPRPAPCASPADRAPRRACSSPRSGPRRPCR